MACPFPQASIEGTLCIPSPALGEPSLQGYEVGMASPQCSHIVEAIIVHGPEHSNDVPCSEGQLCLWRVQETGVRPREALPLPFPPWLTSI